MNSVAAQLTV